jgi:glyoxalase family protein
VPEIKGLHHVTATVENPHEDLDFYVRLLGLRLVKRTVNFDNPGVYHFYYGNAHGSPGTIMTTFPYGEMGVRVGDKGAGQVTATSFSVPAGSLDFWRGRFEQAGIPAREAGRRFDEEVIEVDDPSGLVIEVVASLNDVRAPWVRPEIGAARAILGVHSVTLELNDLGPTKEMFEGVLGFREGGREEDRVRLATADGQPGQIIDLLHVPTAPKGINGIGTVHHVAVAIGSDEEQLAVQEELRRLGYNVTDVRDRQYFHSIYFREPGGVLIEVATAGPGFLIDEEEDRLGSELRLPPWEEPRRETISSLLPDIEVP